MLIIALLLGLAPISLWAEPVDADRVRLAMMERPTSIYGKELRYQIETRVYPNPEGTSFYTRNEAIASTGTRTLIIGRPTRGRSDIPTLIMHYQPNEGEPHTDADPLLTFFQGFDGRFTNTYVRRLLFEYQHKDPYQSSGTQQIGPSIGALLTDPMIRLMGVRVEPFLGRPIKQYEFVEVGDQLQAERVDHPADENAIRITANDPDDDSYMVVSSAPEYLTLERSLPSEEQLFVEISELKSFDGMRYPAHGVYRQILAGGQYEWESTVQLISVQDIDPENIDWTPPWPKGTEWKRNWDRKRGAVPYTREQIKKIRAAGLANARSRTEPEPSNGYFYINVILLTIVAALIAYRLWPRQKETS
jgi:hypothetical protein